MNKNPNTFNPYNFNYYTWNGYGFVETEKPIGVTRRKIKMHQNEDSIFRPIHIPPKKARI